MAAEAISAMWAVARREMLDIFEALQAQVDGGWTISARAPRENRQRDYYASVEIYGHHGEFDGSWISLRVRLADSPYHRPRPPVEVTAEISEHSWCPPPSTFAERTIKPAIDDPDREVEALVADFGRQFVEIAHTWRPSGDR
jgi:hypothetical protein